MPDKVSPETKFKCTCKKGYRGNPYSNGEDKCLSKEEAYLHNLFGYGRCEGCKFMRALRSIFKSVENLRVLDLGTGSCETLKLMLKMGMNATGVESAAFSLEDNCPELLHSGMAIKSKLDGLPFGNSTFDIVFVSHVLEYVPKDSLDGVIAEISRVTKFHVLVTMQTPDGKKKRKGKLVKGLEVESYYSNVWWRERLAASGLDLMDIETHLFLEHARKKNIKLDSQEVAMVLGKVPPEDSRDFPLIHKMYCLACDYMPLVSYMYSPPVTVSQSGRKKKLTMGYTMVLGPSSCNVMRGLLETPPSTLKRAVAFQPAQYTIARDCPDLSRQRLVRPMLPMNTSLPLKSSQADLVLSLFHLELMTEKEIKIHLEELKRVASYRILFLIHTCGLDFEHQDCLANAIPGIMTSRPRKWWSALLEAQGFQTEDMGHALQKRQCRTEQGGATSRMGYCDSVLEELSAGSTYELKVQDIFPVTLKGFHAGGEDIGEMIDQHKGKENGVEEDDETFVDLQEFKDNSDIDPFEYEVKLSDGHRSKHYKEEQRIRDRLKRIFPNAPPAPRTAHIYKSRGYNIRSAGNQVSHEEEEADGGVL